MPEITEPQIKYGPWFTQDHCLRCGEHITSSQGFKACCPYCGVKPEYPHNMIGFSVKTVIMRSVYERVYFLGIIPWWRFLKNEIKKD